MALQNPYKRIYRPHDILTHFSALVASEYVFDKRYSDDRISSCRVYEILANETKKLFNYVEPCDNNLETYSHEIYSLFFRCCTEIESNWKSILRENGFKKKGLKTIKDYILINKDTKLSEYKVMLNWWTDNKTLQPFKKWENNEKNSLEWYQNYNTIKHNRYKEFHLAKLENLLNALAALLIVLFAQYGVAVFGTYQKCKNFYIDKGLIWTDNSLFQIRPPDSWSEEELYGFTWDSIKNDKDPFVSLNYEPRRKVAASRPVSPAK